MDQKALVKLVEGLQKPVEPNTTTDAYNDETPISIRSILNEAATNPKE
jgi:hypothetical protein